MAEIGRAGRRVLDHIVPRVLLLEQRLLLSQLSIHPLVQVSNRLQLLGLLPPQNCAEVHFTLCAGCVIHLAYLFQVSLHSEQAGLGHVVVAAVVRVVGHELDAGVVDRRVKRVVGGEPAGLDFFHFVLGEDLARGLLDVD